MKQLIYGLTWLAAVAFICLAYLGSYNLGLAHQAKESREEVESRAVAGSGDSKYWLKEENGVIQVYQEDKTTLYESTDISVNHLPEELQQEVVEGKPVESSAALYSFLENYSS